MNRHTKAYVYVRIYGGSERKAREAVVKSFQPFVKTKKRQIGRAIRVGRRQVERFRQDSYRSYYEQKRLYERWRSEPWHYEYRGQHEKGFAIDIEYASHEEVMSVAEKVIENNLELLERLADA